MAGRLAKGDPALSISICMTCVADAICTANALLRCGNVVEERVYFHLRKLLSLEKQLARLMRLLLRRMGNSDFLITWRTLAESENVLYNSTNGDLTDC